MSNIPPLTINYPLVDDQGYASAAFLRWITLVYGRIGGTTGSSYNKLTVSSGTVLWDLNQSPNAVVTLQSGTNTFSTPLNLVAGMRYHLTVIQPSSGAKGTISFPDPPFKWPGGTTPTLSIANNAVDILEFFCDGTFLYLIVQGLNYS